MSFGVTIQGQIKAEDAGQVEGIEQQISDALKGALAQFKEHITLASASFDYSGTTDLTPAPESGGGGGEPVFVTKVAGETFEQYKERLFSWNSDASHAQVPAEQQYGDDRSAEWEALPVG